MKNKGIKKFGWARAFVVFWLGLLGAGYIMELPLLGILFILAMLYVIFMDVVNERVFERSSSDIKEEPLSAPYNPDAHGAPIKCPFCGKSIPSDISYCYYCGKSLGAVRAIEKVRVQSIERIDSVIDGIEDGTPKENVKAIKRLTNKILKKYEEDPENADLFSKFTENYLPKTVKAMEHYKVLCGLEKLDADEQEIKAQIEDSLALIKEAFSNILNKVSTEGLEDVSTDISVLEAVLKQEGLTDSDFQ